MTRLTRSAFLVRTGGVGAALFLGARMPAFAAAGIRSFVSRPDLQPPLVTVQRHPGQAAPGLVFLAPSSGPGERGALIVDDTGEPVWFHPTSPATVMNFRAALYRGKPVLTWWEGRTKYGLGVGDHVIFDQSYREIARFPAGNGKGVDLHELLLTPDGTALVTAYDIVEADRSSVGKGRGLVIDGIVQELEVPSARVLFEWSALAHVKLTESYAQVAPRFDFFHANSVELASDGNLIVSARNTWTVSKLDRGSGKIIWRLGGKRSDFAMGAGTAYSWQHDARRHGSDDALLSVFDNAASPQEEPQSRGLLIRLDEKRKRAMLERAFVHRPAQLAHALGSVQLQPNGNVLVGWGTTPWFTEYAPSGSVVWDAKLPHGGQNYRSLRFPWRGTPAEAPRVAAKDGRLYASWNGATDVAHWQLETGKSAGRLTSHATTRRRGFETALEVPPGALFAAAVAIDAKGRPLGRSLPVRLG